MEERKKRNHGSSESRPKNGVGDDQEMKKRKRSQHRQIQSSRHETNGDEKHRERSHGDKGNGRKNHPHEEQEHSDDDGSIDDTVGHFHGANGAIIMKRCTVTCFLFSLLISNLHSTRSIRKSSWLRYFRESLRML
jgi:hypothetical protein